MFVVALACTLSAQTYKVGPGGTATKKVQGQATQTQGQSLGFGSNIQNARLAHGAVTALKNGDHALALDYAQRAVHAAPNDPNLWFLLGYAARLDGRYGQSVDAFSHGLHLSPGSVQGLSGLAQSYSLMGRIDKAEQILKQILATSPNRRDDALLLGNLYLRAGDDTNALIWLKRAERMGPDARSELLLAVTYQHLKQLGLANHYLQLAIEGAPNNPDVLRSLAGYYRTVGKYPQAIAALKSIPNPNPSVKAELAYTYQLDGKLDLSASIYAEAANERPRDLGLQLAAAQAQVSVGAIDAADPFLKRAAGLSPDYYRLHAIRGRIAQLQEHDDQAIQEYKAALAHLPAAPVEGLLYRIHLHMNLMTLQRDVGDDNAAHRQLAVAQTEIAAVNQQAVDRVPFLQLRAQIEMNAGALDSALKDAQEALALSPHDLNSQQLDGDLLLKLGHVEEAIAVYKRILAVDATNRFALTSMGYAARAAGNSRQAEKYFGRLVKDYPNYYVGYLALGDLYTARGEYKKALQAYSKGYALNPKVPSIVSGGMNAAIEAKDLPEAAIWLHRVTDRMKTVPQILAQKERYFYFKGDYQQSAVLGRQAIAALPNNRDVVVYLGYDLLNLNQYNQLLALTSKYNQTFPKEPDIPLLAGYVRRHNGQLQLALDDFTEALQRDPTVVTAHVNRGYVLNDLHRPKEAAADFQDALKREPRNGPAHLGLAYADLELYRSHDALRQSELAEKEMGDSKPLHMIRATAYGREGMLSKAAGEYRAALKFTPNDGTLYLALGNILFAQQHYHGAVDELQRAQKLSPDDAAIYALLARTYAHLQDAQQTQRYVQLAERYARETPAAAQNSNSGLSAVYVATGGALSRIGDQKAAMERFGKALTAPQSNRVGVRLAIAQLMVQQGNNMGAERQIALALMEAEAGDTLPPSGGQYIQAANILVQLRQYELAQTYLGRAKASGAPDIAVRIGLANTYLAQGDTTRAAAELAAVKHTDETGADYAYLLAQAAVYQQEHQNPQALTAFAQAANAAGEDQAASQGLLQTAGNIGYRVNSTLSLLGNFLVQPIYEDTTVYVLDAKLDGPTPVPPTDLSLLPPPRSSIDTQGTVAYHLYLKHLPPASGFFQVDNARGIISVPATSSIVHRDTTNTSLNFGLNPTVHLGRNALTFDSGIQGTIRRDSLVPAQINQNLFRAFTYLSTSSFFNAVSASGYAIWQTGPFTDNTLHSRTLAAAIDFRVGRPWGKTALVTGWGSNDQLFTPVENEYYFTGSYIGLTRPFFSSRLDTKAVVEDVRAWRVFKGRSGIAQSLRPAGTIDFTPARNWNIEGSFAYSNNRSFHAYDAVEDGFSVSYTRAIGHEFSTGPGQPPVRYPIRFSAGFQHEDFFNFTPGKNQQFRPYVSVTIF